jgi:prepilin-type N-terminal cleavage/methylation domain-containing protein
MRFFSEKKQGFTLMEVLVAVSIVVVLATVVMVNIQQAKMKSRDAQRKSDLQQIQLALRLYKDANGAYPATGCGSAGWASPGAVTSVDGNITCPVYIPNLVPLYISKLPLDPLNENDLDKGFFYKSNGTDYKLVVYNSVEKETMSPGKVLARCPSSCSESWCSDAPATHTYGVYSSGAACW